ncbi:L-dopachrome tautomerase yellow-f-like [Lutzomyia longipalpis]|uniref:L-dopachrome tautomerase yellow-f-like n=1 Tax=Lutzomyia longipalpis TaxID=7200 RepID=UPI0024842EE4|nr:L-dopachrome tautomerase yellow-f-like [Lutzomyia longipalpis]
MSFIVVKAVSLVFLLSCPLEAAVENIYYWKSVTYEDQPLADETYIGPYQYNIPENNDVIGLSLHKKSGLMLVGMGRLRPGIPSTLNAFCITDYETGTSPHVWGFPNYEMNTLKASFYGDAQTGRRKFVKRDMIYSSGFYKHLFGDYRREVASFGGQRLPAKKSFSSDDFSIISVVHPEVDNLCNRLYAVDSGILQYSATEIYEVQLPAIIVFELPSNGCESRQFPVIRRVEIPKRYWTTAAGFNFITIDYGSKKSSCDDVFLYITNAFDSSILVYDYQKDCFSSVTDPSMRPIIAESTMVFHDTSMDLNYQLPLGVCNVALGWPDKNGNRNAYYAPGSSLGEYLVSTKILKNFEPPQRYLFNLTSEFMLLGYRGCNSQAYKQIFDEKTGIIFFAEMQSNRVSCWNAQKPINPDNIGVVYEADTLQFVSEIFLDSKGYLWFHSSHVPIDFLTNDPLDISNVVSRTFRVKVSEAVQGTVCGF